MGLLCELFADFTRSTNFFFCFAVRASMRRISLYFFCFMSFGPFIFLNTLEHCTASTVVPNSFVPYLLCIVNTDVQDYICLFYILLINTYHVYIRKNILSQIISGRPFLLGIFKFHLTNSNILVCLVPLFFSNTICPMQINFSF